MVNVKAAENLLEEIRKMEIHLYLKKGEFLESCGWTYETWTDCWTHSEFGGVYSLDQAVGSQKARGIGVKL